MRIKITISLIWTVIALFAFFFGRLARDYAAERHIEAQQAHINYLEILEAKMRPHRGKTKNGKWVKGWYAKIENSHVIIELDNEWHHEGRGDFIGDYVEIIPETVGQQVGLKDKNSEEYYFDDIAKWNNKLWVVVWSITLASIELQPIANYRERQENPKTKRLYGPSFGIGQAHSSKRVGSIHDNPELLEEKK